jgi:hypothetical protein
MSKERRIHPRTVTRLRTTLRRGDTDVEGVTENVGAGGVFFSTGNLEAGVEVGDSVLITLHLADGGTLTSSGVVLRGERYFDGADVRRSFAVKFEAEIDVASLGLVD